MVQSDYYGLLQGCTDKVYNHLHKTAGSAEHHSADRWAYVGDYVAVDITGNTGYRFFRLSFFSSCAKSDARHRRRCAEPGMATWGKEALL